MDMNWTSRLGVYVLLMSVGAWIGSYGAKKFYSVERGPSNRRKITYEAAVSYQYRNRYSFLGVDFLSRDVLRGTVAWFTARQLYDDYNSADKKTNRFNGEIILIVGNVAKIERLHGNWLEIDLSARDSGDGVIRLIGINPVYRRLTNLIEIDQSITVRGLCNCLKNDDNTFPEAPTVTDIEFVPSAIR